MAERRTSAGATLLAAAVLLPLLTRFGGPALLSALAAGDPAPDQNGILIAYLAFWASVAAGVILGVAGLVLLLRRPR